MVRASVCARQVARPRRCLVPWRVVTSASGAAVSREEIVRPWVKAVSLAVLLATVSPAIAGPRAEAVARCQAVPDGIQRRDCFRSLNRKTKAAPPVPSVQDGARDDLATTSAIDHPRAAVGQTFCADRDTLAALLMAGVLASSPDDVTTKGCQTIPEGAQVQILERYPRAFDLFRTVKVQVTTPAMPAPKIGYTIEIGR